MSGLTVALTILLHLAPSLAGMSWSIYQQQQSIRLNEGGGEPPVVMNLMPPPLRLVPRFKAKHHAWAGPSPAHKMTLKMPEPPWVIDARKAQKR